MTNDLDFEQTQRTCMFMITTVLVLLQTTIWSIFLMSTLMEADVNRQRDHLGRMWTELM